MYSERETPPLARSPRKQPIVLWIQCDRGRFLPGECHRSNMTRWKAVITPFRAADATRVPLEMADVQRPDVRQHSERRTV